MTAGQFTIIGSRTDPASDYRYQMDITSEGAVPISGVISASVTAGSESFIYGKSGTGWLEVLVDSAGKLETTASVTVDSVFIASGADIGSVHVNNFADLGSTVVIDDPATIGSLAVQTIDGTVTVTSLASAGSLEVQTVDAVNLDIRDLTSASDSVEVVQGTQADLKSEVYQGTDPWITLGSTQITNAVLEISGNVTISDDATVSVNDLATAGSLAIQTIIGTVGVSTDPVPISGTVGTSGTAYTGSTIIDIFRDVDWVINYTGDDVTSIVQTDGVQTNTLKLVYSGTAVVSGNTVIT